MWNNKMRHTKLKAKLIEAYKKKGKEDLKLLEEWDFTENQRKNSIFAGF